MRLPAVTVDERRSASEGHHVVCMQVRCALQGCELAADVFMADVITGLSHSFVTMIMSCLVYATTVTVIKRQPSCCPLSLYQSLFDTSFDDFNFMTDKTSPRQTSATLSLSSSC